MTWDIGHPNIGHPTLRNSFTPLTAPAVCVSLITRCSPESGFVSRVFREHFFRIRVSVENQPNPGSVHLFPTLFSTKYVLIGITRVSVARRIIKVRNDPELCALRD